MGGIALTRAQLDMLARHLPTLLWALAAAVAMLMPGSAVPSARWTFLLWMGTYADAAAHLLIYLVLVLLACRSLAGLCRSSRPLAAAATFVYSGLLELAQLWVPGRDWDPLDLLWGAAGIALGAAVGARSSGLPAGSRLNPTVRRR